MSNLKYSFVGMFFGIIFVKAEIISWFRMQEMFRFQSFHMFGVIGTAIMTGIIAIQVLKFFKIKTVSGQTITIPKKTFDMGKVYGGLLFGLGWALIGACPGPIFAQIGSGFLSVIITFIFALAGTWTYGYFEKKLPH